jgi:hypothetical protein
MDTSYSEIAQVLQAYFYGFYEGDANWLKQVFHRNCHLYNAADGAFVDDDMTAVYARVENRTPPATENQRRQDRILSIDRSGPESSLAKVQLAIGPKLFTDYLSLLKIDGRWQIVSKTFTYVPIAVEMAQAAE